MDWYGDLTSSCVFSNKPLDLIWYYKQHYITENFVASFKPIVCSYGLKGDILTALYFVDVKTYWYNSTIECHKFKLVL